MTEKDLIIILPTGNCGCLGDYPAAGGFMDSTRTQRNHSPAGGVWPGHLAWV